MVPSEDRIGLPSAHTAHSSTVFRHFDVNRSLWVPFLNFFLLYRAPSSHFWIFSGYIGRCFIFLDLFSLFRTTCRRFQIFLVVRSATSCFWIVLACTVRNFIFLDFLGFQRSAFRLSVPIAFQLARARRRRCFEAHARHHRVARLRNHVWGRTGVVLILVTLLDATALRRGRSVSSTAGSPAITERQRA